MIDREVVPYLVAATNLRVYRKEKMVIFDFKSVRMGCRCRSTSSENTFKFPMSDVGEWWWWWWEWWWGGERIKAVRNRVCLKAAADDEESGLPEGSFRR